MALYMVQFAYTPQAWTAFTKQPEDRTAAVQALAQQWCRVFAALLGGSDFARDAITSGLGLLRSRLGGAPVAVEHEYLGRPRRQTPPGQATVKFLRVVPDPSEIVHGAIGYKGPAAARPSAGNVSRRRRA